MSTSTDAIIAFGWELSEEPFPEDEEFYLPDELEKLFPRHQLSILAMR